MKVEFQNHRKLIIHLKRFKLFPKKRIKITDSIDFPF